MIRPGYRDNYVKIQGGLGLDLGIIMSECRDNYVRIQG